MPRVIAGIPLLSLGLLVGGCGSPDATPTMTPTPTTLAPTPPASTDEPFVTPPAEQADTDWGRIWLSVPEAFPVPLGADPAEPETGPASAAYTVQASGTPNAMAVAQFYVDRFTAAGYRGSRDGPLEDGSYTASGSDGLGCDLLVTAVPRGEETFATVLYGASCPVAWPLD